MSGLPTTSGRDHRVAEIEDAPGVEHDEVELIGDLGNRSDALRRDRHGQVGEAGRGVEIGAPGTIEIQKGQGSVPSGCRLVTRAARGAKGCAVGYVPLKETLEPRRARRCVQLTGAGREGKGAKREK